MAAQPEPPDDLIATLVDPLGRTVWLTAERWGHITDGHPELQNRLEDVKQAVRTAEIRTRGQWDAEKLWARNLAGARWLMVVVRYEGRVGRISPGHRFNRGPGNEERL